MAVTQICFTICDFVLVTYCPKSALIFRLNWGFSNAVSSSLSLLTSPIPWSKKDAKSGHADTLTVSNDPPCDVNRFPFTLESWFYIFRKVEQHHHQRHRGHRQCPIEPVNGQSVRSVVIRCSSGKVTIAAQTRRCLERATLSNERASSIHPAPSALFAGESSV